MFTIAHLSDVHLSPLIGFTPRHWNAKRMLGFVNWQRKRRFVHQRAIANRILADLRAQRPDHIAVTGDLINVGLPAEYEAAARWLETVGAPERVSLVPGNHDIYTALGRDPGIGRWASYMRSDDWGLQQGGAAAAPGPLTHVSPTGEGGFPYVRRAGPIAIVGLCSAIETAPGAAIGTLGQGQLAAARRILTRLGAEGVFRLVMIHHPPLPNMTKPHHELTDADAFARVAAEAGAEAILHGHTHQATFVPLQHEGGRVRVIGVGSASAARALGSAPIGQYNLITISGKPGDWSVQLRRRGFRTITDSIVELSSDAI